MGIRAVFVVFALVGALATTAHAQTDPAAPAEQAQAPAPTRPTDAAAAGAAFMEAFIYESGLIDQMLEPLMAQRMPEMRRELLQSELYNSVSPRAQRSLTAYFDTMPDIMREAVRTEFTEIAGRIGVRLAQRLTAEELNGIADFTRHPSLRTYFGRLAGDYVSEGNGEVEPTPEELAAVEAFVRTPAGMAFEREGRFINTVVTEEFAASSTRMQPQIQSRILNGVCDALGNECPRGLRNATGRT